MGVLWCPFRIAWHVRSSRPSPISCNVAFASTEIEKYKTRYQQDKDLHVAGLCCLIVYKTVVRLGNEPKMTRGTSSCHNHPSKGKQNEFQQKIRNWEHHGEQVDYSPISMLCRWIRSQPGSSQIPPLPVVKMLMTCPFRRLRVLLIHVLWANSHIALSASHPFMVISQYISQRSEEHTPVELPAEGCLWDFPATSAKTIMGIFAPIKRRYLRALHIWFSVGQPPPPRQRDGCSVLLLMVPRPVVVGRLGC